ncbi:unnamed protein product [Ostreobium quekettii]|uniref:FAD-binding PCMH-type domain-containing protein n=1 Tax=Ostreobium quekettii TaxID=121088 RepID=A0A8S1J743_9CHLO|nr:unnamed protein product [Ostreobium quekettii]|eukprot:evm.model.scf_1697.2 EVM.evm.TU.scf_1697.2   scf_1697:4789-10473(-)
MAPRRPRGAWLTAAACLLLLAVCAPRRAQAAVPDDLSNFQNEFVCSADVRIVRPRTIQDVQAAVSLHDKIMPLGAGHSWNKPFFCAGGATAAAANNHQSSANVAMTTMRPMTITVDEQEETAWIDAGILVVDALTYLSNYVTEVAPRGWTLASYPFWVKQTVAGAIATGTHGSTLKHGSLSQQVVALRVVLADGSLAEFNHHHHPFLMKAFRVNMGKLGIVTSVKFRIVREQPVIRTVSKGILPSAFLQSLREAQDMFNYNGEVPRWMNESQVFWIPQLNEFIRYDFDRGDDPDPNIREHVLRNERPDSTTLTEEVSSGEGIGYFHKVKGILRNSLTQILQQTIDARINYPLVGPRAVRTADPHDPFGVAKGVLWEEPRKKHPQPYWAHDIGKTAMAGNALALLTALPGGAFEAHEAYPTYPSTAALALVDHVLYDQYEVAIPFATMADCLAGMLETVYGEDIDGVDPVASSQDRGFRTAPLIRFVSQEEGLLSPTNDGPRMYINMEDYRYYNGGGQRNEPFFRLMAFVRGSPLCNARMHWGKAGWPDAGCFSGAEEYPETWCDFGCAVRALDPWGKFQDSAGDRWNWEGADLERCCNEGGYDRSIEGCNCQVPRLRSVEDCPPSPFYTDQ